MNESTQNKNKTTITIEDNRNKNDEMHNSNSKNKEVSIECTFTRIHIEFDDKRKLCIENDDDLNYTIACIFKKRLKQEPRVEKYNQDIYASNIFTENSSIFTKNVDNANDLFLKLPTNINEKFEITNRRLDVSKLKKSSKEAFHSKTVINPVVNKKSSNIIPNQKTASTVSNNSKTMIIPLSDQDSGLGSNAPPTKCMKLGSPKFNETSRNVQTNRIDTTSTSVPTMLNFSSTLTPIAVLNPQTNYSIINNQSTFPLLQTSHMINNSNLVVDNFNDFNTSTSNNDDNTNNSLFLTSDNNINDPQNPSTHENQTMSEDVRLYIRNHITKKKMKYKYFGEDTSITKPINIAPKSSTTSTHQLNQSFNKEYQQYKDSTVKIGSIKQDDIFMDTPVDMDENDQESRPCISHNLSSEISNSKKPRKSPIWCFFRQESSWTMKCILCNKSLIYKNSATWPLKMHLKCKHKIDLIKKSGKLEVLRQFKQNDKEQENVVYSNMGIHESINLFDNDEIETSTLKNIAEYNDIMDPINVDKEPQHLNLYEVECVSEKQVKHKSEDTSSHCKVGDFPNYIQIPISHSEVGSPLRKFCNLNRFYQFLRNQHVNDLVKCNEKLYFCGKSGLFGSISDDRTLNIPECMCNDDFLAVVYSQERKAALAFSSSQTVCLSVKGKVESISHYYKFRSKSKFKQSIVCMSKVYIQMNDDSIYYQKSLDNLKLLHRGSGEKSFLMVLRKPPRILIQQNENTLLYYGQNFLKNIDLPLIKMTLGCISKGSLLIGRDNEVYTFMLSDKCNESDTFSKRSIKLIGHLDPFDHIDGFDNHLFLVKDNILECRKIGKEEIYPTHCKYEFDEIITKLHIDKNGKIFLLVGYTIWTFDIL